MKKEIWIVVTALLSLVVCESVKSDSKSRSHSCAFNTTYCGVCAVCLENDTPCNCNNCSCAKVNLPQKDGTVYILGPGAFFSCEGGAIPQQAAPSQKIDDTPAWTCSVFPEATPSTKP